MPTGIYPRQRQPVDDRFWAKVKKLESGCWEWQASLTRNGYGRFELNGKWVYAHIFIYKQIKGNITKGLQIDHLCRNRKCVNPDHLELVTAKVNTLRGIGIASKAARATHCPQGHPYNLFNTYLYPNGNRKCRVCRREQMRQYNQGVRDVRTLGSRMA